MLVLETFLVRKVCGLNVLWFDLRSVDWVCKVTGLCGVWDGCDLCGRGGGFWVG